MTRRIPRYMRDQQQEEQPLFSRPASSAKTTAQAERQKPGTVTRDHGRVNNSSVGAARR